MKEVWLNKTKMEHCRACGNGRGTLECLKQMEKALTHNITIFRPRHIYGPGFLLGCFPENSRQSRKLLKRLKVQGTQFIKYESYMGIMVVR